jgi:N-acetyl-gamma-glutamyl-phosphate reductase
VTRVHVVGAAGYAASEVVRLLHAHPHATLGAIESESHAGQRVGDHAPLLRRIPRTFDGPGVALAACAPGDLVVLGGRAADAPANAAAFLQRGARVIDLSDAFRLQAHARCGDADAVYGFVERYRDAVRPARLVANPGCYPTATLLALWPLADFAPGIVQLVIDAKSGVTGAGRTPATASLFAEVDEDVRAYGLGGHRHAPEIAQELRALGIDAPFVFTPHVVPLRRGMLVDAYAVFADEPDADAVRAAFARRYAGSPFVRLLEAEQAPKLTAVAGTNDAELHVSVAGKVVRALCAIDNLGKGAAGQVVQTLNVMLGLPEETALHADSIAI